jgi:hypothetical protein
MDEHELSWWTQDKNEYMTRYLGEQLRLAFEEKRPRTAAVHCVRCRTTVIEVIPLHLPDPSATLLHAIRFRRFEQLPVEVDVPDDAPPGEYGRAMAIAIADRNATTPSSRLGGWETTYILDGSDLGRQFTYAAHYCKDPNGKQLSHQCLLSVDKILSDFLVANDAADEDIAVFDPWPPGWDCDTP